MQLNLLDLLLSHSTPYGTPFGLDKLQGGETSFDQTWLLDWLSESISAARSLISTVLVLPPGGEGAISNTEWIVVYCGLSLAARLDIMMARRNIPAMAQRLRVFLDMPNTLRQIVMRLESVAGSDVDATGDRGTFHHLAQRARRLEEWYLERCTQHDQPDTPKGGGEAHSEVVANDTVPFVAGLDPTSMGCPRVEDHGHQTSWGAGFNFGDGAAMDLGTFLFLDPAGFDVNLGD